MTLCASREPACWLAAGHSTARTAFLTAYQHLVDAQAGHTITSAQATMLDTLANAL